ncbi:MAG: hypothetical protein LBG59_07045 [Candidatus Peribacteria bacterium]|jgi:hypothetical protein|nr:hypothetical protein [Candidatus Peribacteria bacterium]
MIYPTPKKTVAAGLYLHYNYVQPDFTLNSDESSMNIPRYFLDVIDYYMDFRLAETRKIEEAQYYYQKFVKHFQEAIGNINNRDSRPVVETPIDLSHLM